MNPRIGKAEQSEAEATLRLLASLPEPEGLAARMKAGLQAAPAKGRLLTWPERGGMAAGARLRIAAAAVLALAVVGGGWGAYRWVAPAPEARTAPAVARPAMQSGFSTAGAMRTPQTLVGPAAPMTPNTEKKTPAARHGKTVKQDKDATHAGH